jgi:hypothetical protein
MSDHDPLCPAQPPPLIGCFWYDLIARARADEWSKAVTHNTGTSSPDACCECCYEVAQPLRKDDLLIGYIEAEVRESLRAQVEAARQSSVEGRRCAMNEDGTDSVWSAWHSGATSALEDVLALLGESDG